MSNTASVTPYDTDHSTVASATTGAAIKSAASLAAREAARLARRRHRAELRAEVRRQLLDQATPSITSLCLRVSHSDNLIATALGMGYSIVDSQQPPASASGSLPTVLMNDAGHLLAMQVIDNRVVVSSTAGREAIVGVVRQNTLQAVQRYMAALGTAVSTRQTADGSVEVRVRESRTDQAGGAAQLTAVIAPDGTSVLDVDHIKGSRCEALVREYERLTGGKAVSSKRKASYFQLPGEPVRTKVKA